MIYTYESLVYKVSFGLLYCYKLILQLFALLLALCTNDVKVQGLDDAKSIITAVYITTINLIIVIMTYYAYRDYLNTYTALLTLSTYVSTNLILGLVFIPKVYYSLCTQNRHSDIIIYNTHKNNSLHGPYI